MITAQHVQQYHELGYVSFDRFIGPADVEKLRAIFEREFGARNPLPIDVDHIDKKVLQGVDPEQMIESIKASGKYLEDHVNGRCAMRHLTFYNPADELEDVFDTELRQLSLEAGEKLLDITAEELTTFACLLWKPPGSAATPWHQEDSFDPDDAIPCTIGCWIALHEATVANGCMTVIPGTHRGPLRRHPYLGRAEVTADDLARAVSVPLPPGGALLFNGRVLHGSHPNDSPHHRRNISVLLRSPRLRTAEDHTPRGRTDKPRGSVIPRDIARARPRSGIGAAP